MLVFHEQKLWKCITFVAPISIIVHNSYDLQDNFSGSCVFPTEDVGPGFRSSTFLSTLSTLLLAAVISSLLASISCLISACFTWSCCISFLILELIFTHVSHVLKEHHFYSRPLCYRRYGEFLAGGFFPSNGFRLHSILVNEKPISPVASKVPMGRPQETYLIGYSYYYNFKAKKLSGFTTIIILYSFLFSFFLFISFLLILFLLDNLFYLLE